MQSPNLFFTHGSEFSAEGGFPLLQNGSRADRFIRGERPTPRPYNPQTDFRTVDAAERWGLSERQTRRRLNDLIVEGRIQIVVVIYEGRSIQMYSILDETEDDETS